MQYSFVKFVEILSYKILFVYCFHAYFILEILILRIKKSHFGVVCIKFVEYYAELSVLCNYLWFWLRCCINIHFVVKHPSGKFFGFAPGRGSAPAVVRGLNKSCALYTPLIRRLRRHLPPCQTSIKKAGINARFWNFYFVNLSGSMLSRWSGRGGAHSVPKRGRPCLRSPRCARDDR